MKSAWKSGVATGKTSASGSMDVLSSFSEDGPMARFKAPKGPKFSHAAPGKYKHGCGDVGVKDAFSPYSGS